MPDGSLDARARLASNLRRLRIARHTSLSALARATAVSKATLSGIERGQGNPTIDTLETLAKALGVSIGELLSEAEQDDVLIVRAGAPVKPSDRTAARPLESFGCSTGASVELTSIVLPPNFRHEEPSLPPGARRRVLVNAGTLIAGPCERIAELVAGDYYSFPADVPHQYETLRRSAQALVLTYRTS